jgi:hypothetical protein
MKLRLKQSLEPKLGLGDVMINEETKLELSPFIECSTSDPNPGSFTHANCEIIRIEYKRPHAFEVNSATILHLVCKNCGHKFTQYIV